MRPKDDTLQGRILELAREMALKEGALSIHIRAIAKSCGVAVGTVYNYYESKEAILLALAEDFWRNTLEEMEMIPSDIPFPSQMEKVYAFLSHQIADFRSNLLDGLRKANQQKRMDSKPVERGMQQVFTAYFVQRLKADPSITVWSDTFTPEEYGKFVFAHLFFALEQREEKLTFFQQVLQRTLYPVA